MGGKGNGRERKKRAEVKTQLWYCKKFIVWESELEAGEERADLSKNKNLWNREKERKGISIGKENDLRIWKFYGGG